MCDCFGIQVYSSDKLGNEKTNMPQMATLHSIVEDPRVDGIDNPNDNDEENLNGFASVALDGGGASLSFPTQSIRHSTRDLVLPVPGESFSDHFQSDFPTPILDAILSPNCRVLPTTPPATSNGSNSSAAADNATDSSSTSNATPHHNSWRRHFGYWWPAYIILVLIGVAAGVAMLVVVEKTGASPSQANSDRQSNGDQTDSSEHDLFLRLRDIFRKNSDPFAFLVPDSPQSRALTWFATIPQDPTLWEDDNNAQHQQHTASTRLIQRFALIILAFSCSDNTWFRDTITPSFAMNHECNWPRVTCNQDHVVTHLQLDHTGITGSIPEEIGLLSALRSLSAAGNGLEGSLLPLHVYGKLTNLEELALSLNAISSSIPSEIGLLSNSLIAIDFSNNAITGTLPDELKALSKLQFIDVSSNYQLEGHIFDLVPSWSNLTGLYVGLTKLRGNISASNGLPHGIMSKLTGLDVRALRDVDSIPTTIGLMTNLQQIKFGSSPLENNNDVISLEGSLPTEIGLLTNLHLFSIEQTDIEGTIPTEFGLLRELDILFMVDNNLSSTIPSELGMLTRTRAISLAGNHLTGDIPTELGNLTNLVNFALERNEVGMVIPAAMCRPLLRVGYSCTQSCDCCRDLCQ